MKKNNLFIRLFDKNISPIPVILTKSILLWNKFNRHIKKLHLNVYETIISKFEFFKILFILNKVIIALNGFKLLDLKSKSIFEI